MKFRSVECAFIRSGCPGRDANGICIVLERSEPEPAGEPMTNHPPTHRDISNVSPYSTCPVVDLVRIALSLAKWGCAVREGTCMHVSRSRLVSLLCALHGGAPRCAS